MQIFFGSVRVSVLENCNFLIMNNNSGFCTLCGFRIESFEGLTECPNCKTKGIPSADVDQVTISVNWHELRVLCIWAERWQLSNKLDSVVYAIAKRIQEQHPDKAPLTLADEINSLRKEYGADNVSHNIKGVEGAKE